MLKLHRKSALRAAQDDILIWRLVALMLVLCLAGCARGAAGDSASAITASPASQGTRVFMPTLTPIPGLKATLTALPKQSPMPPELARPYLEVRAAVERCSAYHRNRRQAILSQIDYVTYPATVPLELVVMYGDDWPGRLIYGAAYLSALEWKLAGRDRTSCLYPIGVSFNALLRELGQNTFPEFD
jgi:hypothetical protein